MRGTEMARAMKELWPPQLIILITGYANAVNEQSGGLANVDLLLVKPFSLTELQDALVQIFAPLQS
jgi:CheY-like chemotaxis protein